MAQKVNNHSLSSFICWLKGLICLLRVCALICVCVCLHECVEPLVFFQNEPRGGSSYSHLIACDSAVQSVICTVCK